MLRIMETFTDEGMSCAVGVKKKAGNPKFVFKKVTSTARKKLSCEPVT